MKNPLESIPQSATTTNKLAWIRWGIDCLAAVLLLLAAAKFAYFPGDLQFTNLVQSTVGENVGWARTVTGLVSAPSIYVLLGITIALAWWMAGWRGAVLAILSYLVLWQAEPYLKMIAARPRPSANLVRVFGNSSGFSFPSGFGLIFFSTIGYLAVLAHQQLPKATRWVVVTICGVLLLIGGCARIALGAHWLSDIYGAYLIGFVWTKLLVLVGVQSAEARTQ
ncbi:MAG: phosphatase PAP2 family protein [Acidobacteria bacterium]|nr:phosphatase PAP2 family protein [Acidobacteriota bacterium]